VRAKIRSFWSIGGRPAPFPVTTELRGLFCTSDGPRHARAWPFERTASLAYVAGVHVFMACIKPKTWMAGTSPATTVSSMRSPDGAERNPGFGGPTSQVLVMPALVAGIHVFAACVKPKTWMAGTSPAMTVG
jgi:hypothetical protein